MRISRIKFTNFQFKKKKHRNIPLSFFNLKNLINNYKILETLTTSYKYSYSKKLLNKFKRNNFFNIIGMGGSTLGAEAIYQFLKNKTKKKFRFINNLKPNIDEKTKNTKVINLIISKSGNTLETICNSNLLIKKKNNIFITEKKSSYLFNLAKKLKSQVVEHKNFIGGRYSVLSEVGMLPAELMGFNERKFKKLNYLVNNKLFIKNLITNVNFILNFAKQGKLNSIILNYDENSENLFKWYQQLVAESLGKKSKGILPIISTMPRDNHSLLQLYLDGPNKNFFTFFNVFEKKSAIFKETYKESSFKYLRNKSFFEILNAQKKATQNVFRLKRIPFRSFEIYDKNEETLGELFTFFILETILLGKLLKVNPFDQPSVELIKEETRKILS
tara:strand:+ start:1167 stop:2330 length:1164 start_codon:yes stop_codon:yes gene_type:complete